MGQRIAISMPRWSDPLAHHKPYSGRYRVTPRLRQAISSPSFAEPSTCLNAASVDGFLSHDKWRLCAR